MTEQLTDDPATDGRVRRGDRTRRVVLARAVDLASVEGLDGLSIGRLAADLEISKSGLIAHFGLEGGAAARDHPRGPRDLRAHRHRADAADAARDGRVRALLDAWLRVLQRPALPRRLLLRPRLARVRRAPGRRPRRARRHRRGVARPDRGDHRRRPGGRRDRADVDPIQLAFDLDAYLDSANLRSLLGRTGVYEQAERAVRDRLAAAAG